MQYVQRVEARQFNGERLGPWLQCKHRYDMDLYGHPTLLVLTAWGVRVAKKGDYVVKSCGLFLVVEEALFLATYVKEEA